MADNPVLKDVDIRLAMLSYLLEKHPGNDARIISEFGICDGFSRADIAVADKQLLGYEIKSDADDLARLPFQVDFYSKTFDKASIVVGHQYIESIAKNIPAWWGIYYAERNEDARVTIREVRAPSENRNVDTMALLELLWRDELYVLLKQNGVTGISGKNRRILRQIAVEHLNPDAIKTYVLHTIKTRKNWRSENQKLSDRGGALMLETTKIIQEKTCYNCHWYYRWFGVCYNGDSEWCADCPPDPKERCCPLWQERIGGEEDFFCPVKTDPNDKKGA